MITSTLCFWLQKEPCSFSKVNGHCSKAISSQVNCLYFSDFRWSDCSFLCLSLQLHFDSFEKSWSKIRLWYCQQTISKFSSSPRFLKIDWYYLVTARMIRKAYWSYWFSLISCNSSFLSSISEERLVLIYTWVSSNAKALYEIRIYQTDMTCVGY